MLGGSFEIKSSIEDQTRNQLGTAARAKIYLSGAQSF